MKGAHSKRRKPTATDRSTARVLVSGGLWNNLSSVVPILINIAMTPYVIHGLGIARWGLYVLVSTVSVFLGPLNAGVGGAVGRFFALYAARDDRDKTTQTLLSMFCVLLVLGAITTGVGWLLSPVVIHLFGVRGELVGEGVFLLRTLAFLVTLSFLHNLFGSIINARQRWALTNITATASYGVWTIGLICCVHFHLGLRGIAFVFIGQQALATIVIVPSSLQYLTRSGLHFLSKEELKEVWRFARSVQIMGIVQLINSEVDTLLVGGLFSLRTLTFFNSGSNFALQLKNLPVNLSGPAGIYLARVFGAEGEEATLRSFRRLQRLWVIAITGWSVAGLSASYFGIVAWLGPQFKLAGWVAMVLVVGYAVNLWIAMLSGLLSAVGRPEIQMRYSLISVVVNICLTVPLAFTGAVGVAAATSVGAVVAGLYLVRLVRKRYREDVPHFLSDVPMLPSLVAGVVTVALELLIRNSIPSGTVGLVCCAGPALAGMAMFGLLVCRSNITVVTRALLRGRAGLPDVLRAVGGSDALVATS